MLLATISAMIYALRIRQRNRETPRTLRPTNLVVGSRLIGLEHGEHDTRASARKFATKEKSRNLVDSLGLIEFPKFRKSELKANSEQNQGEPRKSENRARIKGKINLPVW